MRLCVDTLVDSPSLPDTPPRFQIHEWWHRGPLGQPIYQLNTTNNQANSTLSRRNHPGWHMRRQCVKLLYWSCGCKGSRWQYIKNGGVERWKCSSPGDINEPLSSLWNQLSPNFSFSEIVKVILFKPLLVKFSVTCGWLHSNKHILFLRRNL